METENIASEETSRCQQNSQTADSLRLSAKVKSSCSVRRLRHSQSCRFSCSRTPQQFDGAICLATFLARNVHQRSHIAQLVTKPLRLFLGEAETYQSPRTARHRGKVLFNHKRMEKGLGTDEETDGRNHDRAEF